MCAQKVAPDGPDDKDAADGCPDDAGVVHANVVGSVHNVKVLAGSSVVDTWYHAVRIPPVRLHLRGGAVVLNVLTSSQQVQVGGHGCSDNKLVSEDWSRLLCKQMVAMVLYNSGSRIVPVAFQKVGCQSSNRQVPGLCEGGPSRRAKGKARVCLSKFPHNYGVLPAADEAASVPPCWREPVWIVRHLSTFRTVDIAAMPWMVCRCSC